MKQNPTAHGFSAIEAAILVLVAAVIGTAGWLIYLHSKPRSTHMAVTGPAKTAHTTPAADPSEGGKYLYIKEWGVRFLLPVDMQGDVSYGLERPDNRTQYAWLEVGKLANIPGSNCKLHSEADGVSGGAGILLTRLSSAPTQEETLAHGTDFHKLGSYWYTANVPKGSCLPSRANDQLEADTDFSLVHAFNTLQVVSQ